MAMNMFLEELKEMREMYLSSSIKGGIILADELYLLIEATKTKIKNNIKHYNGDEKRATDRFMLEKWANTIEDYYLIFKQMDNLDSFTKKQFRILANQVQYIAVFCD